MCPVCGIAGLYSPAGPPNPELVDAMRAALVHRGPDEGTTDAFGRCVISNETLASPKLAVGTVAETVKYKRDHIAVELVLSHAGGDVSMMMLNTNLHVRPTQR